MFRLNNNINKIKEISRGARRSITLVRGKMARQARGLKHEMQLVAWNKA